MKITYKEKYRRIKKFVNINHDLRLSENNFNSLLSRQEKSEISHYFKTLYGERGSYKEQGAINIDVYLYRPRSKKRKELAAKYAQIEGAYKKLKVIPIPRADKENPIKLKFKNNTLEVQEKNITRRVAFFNMKQLATDPKMEVLKIVKQLQAEGKLDAILPLAGAREILDGAQTEDPEIIAERIMFLMNKYSESFQKWLLGLAGYEFTNQDSFLEYRKARKKTKDVLAKRKLKCKNCNKDLTKTDLKNNKCSKCKTKIVK